LKEINFSLKKVSKLGRFNLFRNWALWEGWGHKKEGPNIWGNFGVLGKREGFFKKGLFQERRIRALLRKKLPWELVKVF